MATMPSSNPPEGRSHAALIAEVRRRAAKRRFRRRATVAWVTGFVVAAAVGVPLALADGGRPATVKVIAPPNSSTTALFPTVPVSSTTTPRSTVPTSTRVTVSPTSTSSVPSRTSITATPTACGWKHLSTTAYQASGAGGHEAVVVVLTNTGPDTCTIDGYPAAAWFVSAGGNRLPGTVVEQATTSPTVVRVAPGAKASTTVWSTSPGVPSPSYCHPTATSGVDVVPPGQTASVFAQISITVCGSNNVVGTTPFTGGTTRVAR